jgi:hypothetical protein
VDREL